MKKTFAFVCACMFGLAVVGCGGEAATTTETPTENTTGTEATTTDDGATTEENGPVAEEAAPAAEAPAEAAPAAPTE